ncbi:MAG TPA: MBL fold metallo-hydrolase [Thermoleophilia bacterium]|nr:MBL fold metallo-hydrolase [Thermoleophilia bacterium]
MLEHVHWLGHDTFRIDGSSVVYVDPWKLPPRQPQADVILVTHDHYDHFSLPDIDKVAGPGTIVVGPSCVTDQLPGRAVSPIRPGQTITAATATVTAVAAYNVDKFKSPGVPFHPRSAGYVGYIIDMDGMRIYHAGDTDPIPEMDDIDVDVALLPVGGTFTCTAQEAASVCARLKAKVAVPMHFGDIVGSERDARRFQELCSIPVTILRAERG